MKEANKGRTTLNSVIVLLLAVVATFAAACAATPTEESTGGYVDDATITAKIKTKYAIDRDLSAFGISVNTTDGRVTLAGHVTSHQQIGKAMLIALETDGVREVSSTLQVKSPPRASS